VRASTPARTSNAACSVVLTLVSLIQAPRCHARDIVIYLRSAARSTTASSATLSPSELPSSPAVDIMDSLGVVSLQAIFPGTSAADTLYTTEYGNVVRVPDLSGWFTAVIPDSVNPGPVIEALTADTTDVASVHLPAGMTVSLVPNDSLLAGCWYLGYQQPTPELNVLPAWDRTQGDDALVLAILDTGVGTHPDLNPSGSQHVLPGFGFRSTTGTAPISPGFIADVHDPDHGTAVAGVAGAIGNNRIGMAGILWQGHILPITVTSGSDVPTTAPDNFVAAGTYLAILSGAQILNISLGSPSLAGWSLNNPIMANNVLADATYWAYMHGGLVVAAAGNDNVRGVEYPAAFPWVMGVGGTNGVDQHWTQILQGGGLGGSNYGPSLDMVAPAGPEVSATLGNCGPDGCYSNLIAGTSFASPGVAAVAGLVWSRARAVGVSLTNDDLRGLLHSTARDPLPVGWDETFGWGIPDAGTAVGVFDAPFIFYGSVAYGGADAAVGAAHTVTVANSVHSEQNTVWFGTVEHRVTQHVSFSSGLLSSAHAWARGRGCVGTHSQVGLDGMPWAEVTNTTTDGFDITTYVYRLGYDVLGRVPAYPWYPCAPNEVQLRYGVVGRPVPPIVSVSGSSHESAGATASWTVSVTGAWATPTYSWRCREVRPSGFGAWTALPGSGQSTSVVMGQYDLQTESMVACLGDTVRDTVCCYSTSTSPGPTVNIGGPTQVVPGAAGTWTAIASGGRTCGSYLYEWKVKPSSASEYGQVISRAATLTYVMPEMGDLDVSLDVWGQLRGNAGLRVTPLDVVPPAAVSDLGVDAVGSHSMWFSWTESGDDGSVGTATAYELRMSQTGVACQANNFASASIVASGTPVGPGDLESICVSGLQANTWYYFALKVRDEAGNWSTLSNCVHMKTTSGGGSSAQRVGGSSSAAAGRVPGILSGREAARRFRMQWSVAADTSELVMMCLADSSSVDSSGAAVTRVMGGTTGDDTTVVVTSYSELGLALRRTSSTFDLGRTWEPTALADYAYSTGSSPRIFEVVGIELRKSSFAQQVAPGDWEVAPSALGAGDTLRVKYVCAPTDSDFAEYHVWFTVEGNGDGPLAADSSASGADGPREVPAVFGLKVLDQGRLVSGVRLQMAVPTAAPGRLEIFDVAGRRVRTLASGIIPSGTRETTWDARDESGAPSRAGLYLCRLTVGSQRATTKFVLAR
jgi:hypothetical protein